MSLTLSPGYDNEACPAILKTFNYIIGLLDTMPNFFIAYEGYCETKADVGGDGKYYDGDDMLQKMGSSIRQPSWGAVSNDMLACALWEDKSMFSSASLNEALAKLHRSCCPIDEETAEALGGQSDPTRQAILADLQAADLYQFVEKRVRNLARKEMWFLRKPPGVLFSIGKLVRNVAGFQQSYLANKELSEGAPELPAPPHFHFLMGYQSYLEAIAAGPEAHKLSD